MGAEVGVAALGVFGCVLRWAGWVHGCQRPQEEPLGAYPEDGTLCPRAWWWGWVSWPSVFLDTESAGVSGLPPQDLVCFWPWLLPWPAETMLDMLCDPV